MKWHRLVGSASITFGFLANGCGTGPGLVAADPDLPRAVAAAGSGPAGQARSQKPESENNVTPVSLLSTPPERPAELAALGRSAARIQASVNNEAILDEEVRTTTMQEMRLVEQLPEPERSRKRAEVWKHGLDQLIEREVVIQDAVARLTERKNLKALDKLREAAGKEFEKHLDKMRSTIGIKNEEDFKTFLNSQGMPLPVLRRQWERNFMANEYLSSRAFPLIDKIGHAQVVEYYEGHPEEFLVPDSVQWQDLFVSASRHASREAARRFAEVLAARARQGEDFLKLSAQFDNGDSALRNGDGLGSKHGEISPPEAETFLFAAREGDVGVIELASGYHVVKLVKRVHAGPLPFDEKLQRQIRDKLKGEVFQREKRRIVVELKRKAVIEYAR